MVEESGYLPISMDPDDKKSGSVGPLTVAAILRGTPHAALKHRINKLRGTAWGKLAESVTASSNGASGERLLKAFTGIRIAGHTELETRRMMLGEICKWDGFVEDWLAIDPEFQRREGIPECSLEDIAGMFEATTWLWDKWIPRGFLSMICGASGAGKSYIAQWIASNIMLGRPLPDGSESDVHDEASRVMWIDTEATHSLVIQRATTLGIRGNRFVWPLDPKHPTEQFPRIDISKPYWAGIVTDYALRRKPIWIVVDSLRGSHMMDENSSDVQAMLGAAAAIARDVGCGFTFIHHLRKKHIGETEVTLDSVRGSSAIVAMMRVVIAVDQPDPMRNDKRLRVIKSNLGVPPEPQGVYIGENGPMRLNEVPTPPRKMSRVDLAAEFVRSRLEDGPAAYQDIIDDARDHGISKASIQRARYQLGIVVRRVEKHWEWSLPARDDQQDPPF